MAEEFVFIDHKHPEVFYYGNLLHVRGCNLAGGNAERYYNGVWEGEGSVKLWRNLVADKKVGDEIDGKPVIAACAKWFMAAYEDEDNNLDGLSPSDSFLNYGDVFDFQVGDCIHGLLLGRTLANDFVAVKEHPNDRDLLLFVKFEVIGYEPGPHEAEEVFVEDKEGQNHVIIHFNSSEWIHREDLIGMQRVASRSELPPVYLEVLKKLFE